MCRVKWNPIHVLMIYASMILSLKVPGLLASPAYTTNGIPFISMTATSSYDEFHAARDAILSNTTSAWCAGNSTSQQYIQVNFEQVFELQGIATQGLYSTNDISGHVTAYKMKVSLNGLLWRGYRESNQSKEMILPGNNNSINISYNILDGNQGKPLKAKFVRIYPVKWLNNICMRIGLFGVPINCSLMDNRCMNNKSDVKNSTISPCPRGFYRHGNICTDIDECISNITCRANSTCVNFPGSFNCLCLPGYRESANTCIDINECTTHNHSCSAHAQCINIAGSYICRCTSGYYDKDNTCLDVDECSMNLTSCHENASCTNTQGSYMCRCNNGYEGDGLNCTDINECTSHRHDVCSRHAICTNVPGSFYCVCAQGYRSAGQNCTADSVAGPVTHRRYLIGIAIGLPVIAIVILISVSLAYIVTRHRRKSVVRRPKPSNQTSSRPASTVIGQIDKLFDDERKLRDSVSLNSLQFSIPSVHPSLTALNNIGINNTKTPYETL